MQCVWLVYLLTKFIGAVLFVRLIRLLYYAKLLADGLSVRLKSLSWAGTQAALLLSNLTMTGAMGKTRDYTPGVNLCPPSGSNSPPAGRIVSCQHPWGGGGSRFSTGCQATHLGRVWIPDLLGSGPTMDLWSLAGFGGGGNCCCPWFLPLCLRLGGIKRFCAQAVCATLSLLLG